MQQNAVCTTTRSTKRSDKGGTHKGFQHANMSPYKQPSGRPSGFCSAGKHSKCISLACSCECHDEE
jgi:hypothetical protein